MFPVEQIANKSPSSGLQFFSGGLVYGVSRQVV